MIQRTCRELGGFEPDIRHRANDATVALAAVGRGLAVTMLPGLPLAGHGPEHRRAGHRRARAEPHDPRGDPRRRRRAPLDAGAARRGHADCRAMPALTIAQVLAVPATGGYFADDQAAIGAGAPRDGLAYPGPPVTPGFDAIRAPAEAVSVLLVLSDGHVAHGDCVSVQYGGVGGREPRLRAGALAALLERDAAPLLRGAAGGGVPPGRGARRPAHGGGRRVRRRRRLRPLAGAARRRGPPRRPHHGRRRPRRVGGGGAAAAACRSSRRPARTAAATSTR